MATVRFLHAPPPLPGAHRRAGDDYGAKATPDWREVDWSEHLYDVEIGGRRVRFCDYGPSGSDSGSAAASDAPPVVMLHGLGGAWQNWLENIPRIAQERRVIAPDLPGHGCSEMPADKISISGFGRCVEELCERLDLGEVVFVGNSTGGFTGTEVAIQHPDRVAGLVLVSAAGITINDLRRQPTMTGARLVAFAGTWAATRAEHLVTRRRTRWLTHGSFIRYPERIPTDLLYEISYTSGKEGWWHTVDALISYDLRDRLPDIRCPTLVVWGKHDMLVPVRDASEFERLIPNARKVVFEDTGHVSMIERPTTFNETLVEFLREGLESPKLQREDAEAEAETAGAGDPEAEAETDAEAAA